MSPYRQTIVFLSELVALRVLLDLGLKSAPVHHIARRTRASQRRASDGKVVWVQGPRKGNLVELNLAGTSRRTVAASGWVQDAVALTWDGKRDRLLAIDAKTGNLYEVDPTDGTKSVVSAHDADYPTGFERGLVIDGDTAYTIARDRNGILEIDLETGDRSFLGMTGDGLEETDSGLGHAVGDPHLRVW